MREPTKPPEEAASFAEAIYANEVEYPHELAFEQGDVLRVLSTQPGIEGISEGWWLCVDKKGNRGVAPANRLKIMSRLDGTAGKGFFEVANPLFDDFFMFSSSPLDSRFDDPFFRGGPRSIFPPSLRDRLDPLRRVASCDDTLNIPPQPQVVRNIPIRIVDQRGEAAQPNPVNQRASQPEPRFVSSFENESRNGNGSGNGIPDEFPPVLDYGRRFSDFALGSPRELRRTVSSGRVSPPLEPPVVPTRKFVSTQQLSYVPENEFPANRNTVSSESDEERMSRDVPPQRTLVLPGSVPGRTIEIPLGGPAYGGSTLSLSSLPSQQRSRGNSERDQLARQSMRGGKEHQTNMEKLTQRLRSLAGKPFRSLSTLNQTDGGKIPEHKTIAEETTLRTPSPSSSGICTDMEPSSSEEKRTSDVSSLSDQNSSMSDHYDDVRNLGNGSVHTPKQPYLSRIAPSTSNFPSQTRQEDDGSRREWSTLPTTVEEDMRRNKEQQWTHIPTKVVGESRNGTNGTARTVGDILEDELQSRKQVVCNRLADIMRAIDHSMALLSKCTAMQHWRAAHILQGNLSTLRETFYTLTDQLDAFLETTGRISIDRTNIRYVELNKLLAPLSDSRSLLSSLRKTLDHSGWTVAVLGRDRLDRDTNDTLQHFVNVAKQVPADCRRLLQWTQDLTPTNSILFLSPSSTSNRLSASNVHTHSPLPFAVPRQTAVDRPIQLLNGSNDDADKRHSTSSTSTVGGGTATSSESSQSTPSSILVTPQSKQERRQDRGRVTFADEQPDRNSTGSSIDTAEYATILRSPLRAQTAPQAATQTPILSSAKMSNGVPMLPVESRIIEEDDLESVVSDRESLFQDYAYLDDVVPGRSSSNSAHAVNDQDRELIRFYSPQFDEHTDSLTMAVEEFLATVENNLPPREFVQKGKLIILAAHKLIYIGDSVSQCVGDAMWADQLKTCADHLCAYLRDCVQAMRNAADEYPDIRSMQTMVDAVMNVSTAAHDLKTSMRSMI